MKLVVRQKASRRTRQSAEFPLTDSEDVPVARDRRQLPDRRKPVHDLSDLKAILSKMGAD